MRQYNSIKEKYPDAILLFRVGDFYETFGKDAITVSKILGIILTKRANGSASAIELAGFPHHSLNTYLPKIVQAGFRVAICDQLEDPKLTKTIVKRGVTELVTPGVTALESNLKHNSNNYLAVLHFVKGNIGVAFIDISTGEFLISQGNSAQISKIIQSFAPAEVICSRDDKHLLYELISDEFYTYYLDEWAFSKDFAYETLQRHFKTHSLKGFAGVCLHYLNETKHDQLQHVSSVARIPTDNYVWLDQFTIRNLELINSTNVNGKALLQIIDKTITPMGARLLKKWVLLPLKEVKAIQARQGLVTFFIENRETNNAIEFFLKEIGDLERLIARVPMRKVGPRHITQLKNSLIAVNEIKNVCANTDNKFLNVLGDKLNECKLIIERIENALVDEPPAILHKSHSFKLGINEELDKYKEISLNSKQFLEDIKLREAEKTGISSLKIGFNNVFGYYLEVTHRFKDKVPDEWVRKQTLTSAERYITPELKELESKILSADEKIRELEAQLFEELLSAIVEYVLPIQINAKNVAQLDCLMGFANLAIRYQYKAPELNDSLIIDIKNGRHPVIEQNLPAGESYVPNDVYLDDTTQQLIIVTGPNMSGKSAILRQTALVVLLAQIGSYVPVESAAIGVVDKIFTRVGASDNLSMGESTFMVEMNETASIMNNLSNRSLVLLDEIGRGTSTYDGISIAWALAEYLHDNPTARPKTLFATHYHELNELANKHERVQNYHVAVKEQGNKVIFLRKLTKGGSEHSFGIYVAKLAGMPDSVVARANDILLELEEKNMSGKDLDTLRNLQVNKMQLNLFSASTDPKLKKLKELLTATDVDRLTPIEALLKLNELKRALD
ncbi:UNVERIFIED_CONTAM: hypothetical protein GTU68_042099 [Idotea baltica]|nr:hypothetical protein [Idotea baltica]